MPSETVIPPALKSPNTTETLNNNASGASDIQNLWPEAAPLSIPKISPAARRNAWFIIAQFSPMAMLSYVFIEVNPVLEHTRAGSMRVFELMVIASVLSPLISQTISGPIFAA